MARSTAPITRRGDAGAVPAARQQPDLLAWIRRIAYRLALLYAFSAFWKYIRAPASSGKTYGMATNIFPDGQLFDFHMYLSESKATVHDFGDPDLLIWCEMNLMYGDWSSGPNADGSLEKTISFPTPDVLLRNGSLYLHVFVTKHGNAHNPSEEGYEEDEVAHEIYQLNKYKKKLYKKTANLLTGFSEQSEEDLAKAELSPVEILNYWHPNLTVNLIVDQYKWTKDQLDAPYDEAVKFVGENATQYKPIIFFNDFWNLGSQYFPINETVKNVNLTLTYAPLSLSRMQIFTSEYTQGFLSTMLSGEKLEEGEDDMDAIKVALLETNPYLLGITIIATVLHIIFEYLAFKNDIEFWRNCDSLEGLSVRSVLFNIFQFCVMLLYVYDNDASWVVIANVAAAMLIEVWKISKCLDIHVDLGNKIFGFVPKVTFSDKGSYIKSSTREYDQLAFKYLSWLLYPLVIAYAAYTLLYVEQRGWYSWILSMMYSFFLTFGFIMMTPQLFINYKLKSVAHLPWRMMTYKFINTFIDDLFAFVIRMPMMYRLGCFRDDIIFLIYLYQRWIYKVDPKRVNEFGTSLENPNGVKKQDAIKAPHSDCDQKKTTKSVETKKNK
ncbi:hypothetical protein QR680_007704 [Steinernema hermaphroditum]|uniref:Cleft lip and palate transmembrane protein 1 n=1 Tax=Steinernema hermaphroditum TaxID=289476 RepID=A0AA39M6J6_9BILA|nr:hypothetical protein QR680_007704 [Steinernema hermaphroditum]